jgi:hypothetical protein
MGYYTTFNGGLTVEPPLTWPEIQTSHAWPGHPRYHDANIQRYHIGAMLHVTEASVETAEGTLIRRQARTVTVEGAELRAGEVLDSLRRLAADFGATHRFDGTLLAEGEENEDIWRVTIVGTEVVRVDPVLLWPGDSKALANVRTTLLHDGHVARAMATEDAEILAARILRNLADMK